MIDKKQIHAFCIEKQEEEVENFASRVSSLKADVNTHNESASQTEERNAGDVELLRNYEQELRFSQMEMTNLQSLDPAVAKTKVEPGAVVMTNHLNFYISIPLDKIEIEGVSFIGISTKAPLYSAMQGKKKGDTFKLNDMEYNIIEVY
ncbi:MAG: hypothetical protein ABIP79_16700 [Chitinophagaceae bacterium]